MKDLIGFGLGYRPPHYNEISDNPPKIDFFEIITENFLSEAARPRQFLEKLKRDFPVAAHGVSLSIASIDDLDRDYLKRLKSFTHWLKPKILSDHLCWVKNRSVSSHDLLPVPYTKEALKNVISKVAYVQDFLGTQLVLENPSAYVSFSSNEMDEADFFNELCQVTGCGILLDINNLYVNWKNLGADPYRFLSKIPKDFVKQFHLAGHSIQDGVLIDTHDHPIANEVWDLYKKATNIYPEVPTLIEWDDKIPTLEILLGEVEKAKKYHQGVSDNTLLDFKNLKPIPTKPKELTEVYDHFFSTVIHLNSSRDFDIESLEGNLPTPSTAGLRVYSDGYILRIEKVLRDLFPCLFYVTEADAFRVIVTQYLQSHPPRHYSISRVGENLPHFLRKVDMGYDFGVSQSVLSDIAQFEWSQVEAFESASPIDILSTDELKTFSPTNWESIRFHTIPSLRALTLNFDIDPVLQSFSKNLSPAKPAREISSYIVWQNAGSVRHLKLEKVEAEFLENLQYKTFKESCENQPLEQGLARFLKFVSIGLFLNSTN